MRPLWFVLPLAFVAVPPAPASAQVIYAVTDLGTDSTRAITARAINNAGQVTGQFPGGDGFYHAFRWSAAAGMVDLGQGDGMSINASGRVAGTNYVNGQHAYRTTLTGGINAWRGPRHCLG